MEDIIARFKESCGKVGDMIKEFIARFKKAWAAFVRTWRFEKDVGSTTERVRKEVEYAIECERKGAIEENDYAFLDYAVECYRYALRAYETMAEDGHSGMSWGLTRQIFNRLAEGKPLKTLNSYHDRPEEWSSNDGFDDDIVRFNNKRYNPLYCELTENGMLYHDVDRWRFYELDNPNVPWSCGLLSRYMDEHYPITFPYNPVNIHVRMEELLTDPAHGDYDAQRIIDFVDPETGETIKVDACFEEVDGEWQEIGKKKWYALRKKHGERLAAILRTKED